jgi:hypothetical protein
MIRIDSEGESFVFENEWDIAIPISVEHIYGSEPVIEVFPQIEAVAKEYQARFSDDLLSDVALGYLWSAIGPYALKWGYSDDKFRDRWGYIFRADEPALPCFDSEHEAVILSLCKVPPNMTTLDIEYCVGSGHAAAAILHDGKIVSAAMTHEPTNELLKSGVRYCEIGVETAPEHRRKGYASACAVALSKYLASIGLTSEYRCQRYNQGSYAVAMCAGMRECGKFYSYVLRRNDQEK